MPKKLIVGQEIYEYPDGGSSNYAEEATGWAEAVTSILSEISNPGDIPTVEVTLEGTSDGTVVSGSVPRMFFDTSFVQRVEINGFITKEFVKDIGNGPEVLNFVEEFTIRGVVSGGTLKVSVSLIGDDTELEFDTNGGQVLFSYPENQDESEVSYTIKFNAKAIINEEIISE